MTDLSSEAFLQGTFSIKLPQYPESATMDLFLLSRMYSCFLLFEICLITRAAAIISATRTPAAKIINRLIVSSFIVKSFRRFNPLQVKHLISYLQKMQRQKRKAILPRGHDSGRFPARRKAGRQEAHEPTILRTCSTAPGRRGPKKQRGLGCNCPGCSSYGHCRCRTRGCRHPGTTLRPQTLSL